MQKLFKGLIFLLALGTAVSFGCTKTAPPKKQLQETKEKAKEAVTGLKFTTTEAVYTKSTEKPKACASCHIKVSADKDYSLQAEIKKIKGHPEVAVNKVSDCLKCHKEDKRPLKKILHQKHYRSGSVFVDKYKAACIHCHKLNTKGELVVPGLAPARAKYTAIETSQVDKAPNGCSDCHKKVSPDKDYSLTAELKKIPGHPQKDISDFNQCFDCHGKTVKDLGSAIHPKHLTSKIYHDRYGGSCVNCHTLKIDGTPAVKGRK